MSGYKYLPIRTVLLYTGSFPISLEQPLRLPWWLSGKESACSAGDAGSISGWGRSPGEGNGNPLQYSSLENPMERGAWWAVVHGVANSQTWLKWLSRQAHGRCSRSLALGRAGIIKTRVRYHGTAPWRVVIAETDSNKLWKEYGKTGSPHILLMGLQNGVTT